MRVTPSPKRALDSCEQTCKHVAIQNNMNLGTHNYSEAGNQRKTHIRVGEHTGYICTNMHNYIVQSRQISVQCSSSRPASTQPACNDQHTRVRVALTSKRALDMYDACRNTKPCTPLHAQQQHRKQHVVHTYQSSHHLQERARYVCTNMLII